MTTTKFTQKDFYNAIIDVIEGNDLAISGEEIIEFCNKKIAAIDKKAETAKAKAAEKRVKGDELSDAIRNVLTNEPQTLADLAAAIDGEDVTVAKVQYRVNQLVKNDEATKVKVSVTGEDGKTRELVAFTLFVDAEA